LTVNCALELEKHDTILFNLLLILLLLLLLLLKKNNNKIEM
jgi:hypothetical protein